MSEAAADDEHDEAEADPLAVLDVHPIRTI